MSDAPSETLSNKLLNRKVYINTVLYVLRNKRLTRNILIQYVSKKTGMSVAVIVHGLSHAIRECALAALILREGNILILNPSEIDIMNGYRELMTKDPDENIGLYANSSIQNVKKLRHLNISRIMIAIRDARYCNTTSLTELPASIASATSTKIEDSVASGSSVATQEVELNAAEDAANKNRNL